jgi:cell division protein DivIC
VADAIHSERVSTILVAKPPLGKTEALYFYLGDMSKVGQIRKRIRSWRIPKILLNRYVFTLFVFLIWMAFFDQNNLFVQQERLATLRDAKQKIEFYERETEKTEIQLKELMSSDQTLEKFAREKYYMKKPNEDVFVIVRE